VNRSGRPQVHRGTSTRRRSLQAPSPRLADEGENKTLSQSACIWVVLGTDGSTDARMAPFQNVSRLNRRPRAGFMGRPAGKHATGARSREGREQRASWPRAGCRGGHKSGCGMSSCLHHLPEPLLPTGVSHDSE